MTLKLYFAPGACSFVPHTLLEASGAAFEPVMVKLHKRENYSDAYQALNPRAQVPVLVDGDDVITQIVAIISHLDARFPQLGILPPGGLARVRALETLAWMNNTVHPTFAHIFMPHKFAGDESVYPALKAFNTEQYRAHLAELQVLVDQAAGAGRPWLTGEQFGALDAYTLTLARWGTMAGINPADTPRLWAFVQRVAQVPAAARSIERERLQLNLYAPA